MVSFIAGVFGVAVLVAMTLMAAALIYVGFNEESYAHAAAQAEAEAAD
jgi:flagellin-like protein